MTIAIRVGYLFFIIGLACFQTSLKAQGTIRQIVVNQPLSFGYIKYYGSTGFFTVTNSALQSLGANSANYTATNVHLAEIEVFGEANEVVTFTFSSSQVENGNSEINVTNVTTSDMSNSITLDSNGRAKVSITGNIKINKTVSNNKFGGNITVWANYSTSNVRISQVLPWFAEVQSIFPEIISTLSFGKVIERIDRDCYITVHEDGTSPTSNCTGYSGIITPVIIRLPGIKLPIPPVVPTTIYIASLSPVTLLMIDNFSYKVQEHLELFNTYTDITVGATLHIPASTKGIYYSGLFDISWIL